MYHKIKKEYLFIFLLLFIALVLFTYFENTFNYTGLTTKGICEEKGYQCCTEGEGTNYFSLDYSCQNNKQCWSSCLEKTREANTITASAVIGNFWNPIKNFFVKLFSKEVVGTTTNCCLCDDGGDPVGFDVDPQSVNDQQQCSNYCQTNGYGASRERESFKRNAPVIYSRQDYALCGGSTKCPPGETPLLSYSQGHASLDVDKYENQICNSHVVSSISNDPQGIFAISIAADDSHVSRYETGQNAYPDSLKLKPVQEGASLKISNTNNECGQLTGEYGGSSCLFTIDSLSNAHLNSCGDRLNIKICYKITTATPNQYTLTINYDSNKGTVSKSPLPNLNGRYNSNTLITLTANPNEGYIFTGWDNDLIGENIGENIKRLTINRDITITANFGVQGPLCGNNIKEEGEECDGYDFGLAGNSKLCNLYNSDLYRSGDLICNPSTSQQDKCEIDTSSCVLKDSPMCSSGQNLILSFSDQQASKQNTYQNIICSSTLVQDNNGEFIVSLSNGGKISRYETGQNAYPDLLKLKPVQEGASLKISNTNKECGQLTGEYGGSSCLFTIDSLKDAKVKKCDDADKYSINVCYKTIQQSTSSGRGARGTSLTCTSPQVNGNCRPSCLGNEAPVQYSCDNNQVCCVGQGTIPVTTETQGNGEISVTPERQLYNLEESIRITATPSQGSRFSKWIINNNNWNNKEFINNPMYVRITSPTIIKALFEALPPAPTNENCEDKTADADNDGIKALFDSYCASTFKNYLSLEEVIPKTSENYISTNLQIDCKYQIKDENGNNKRISSITDERNIKDCIEAYIEETPCKDKTITRSRKTVSFKKCYTGDSTGEEIPITCRIKEQCSSVAEEDGVEDFIDVMEYEYCPEITDVLELTDLRINRANNPGEELMIRGKVLAEESATIAIKSAIIDLNTARILKETSIDLPYPTSLSRKSFELKFNIPKIPSGDYFIFTKAYLKNQESSTCSQTFTPIEIQSDTDDEPPAFETSCTDLIDNDNDGSEDCEDDDCSTDQACLEEQCIQGIACSTNYPGICSTGIQSCLEDGSFGECTPSVMPGQRQKNPNNGLDNDCDGEIDRSLELSRPPTADSDNDGLPDSWEMQNFNTLLYNADDDQDNDGISNIEEYRQNTDPNMPDEKKLNLLWLWIVLIIFIFGIILFVLFKLLSKPKTGGGATGSYADPRLKSYVQDSLRKGFTKNQIRQALLTKGWSQRDIDKVLR